MRALLVALAVLSGRRVVLFDNRGTGRSRLGTGTVTIRRMADDAAALIRRLRLGRPDVLGYSMGGMMAQSLAFLFPAGREAARDRYAARLARRRDPQPVGPQPVVQQQLAASATWPAAPATSCSRTRYRGASHGFLFQEPLAFARRVARFLG